MNETNMENAIAALRGEGGVMDIRIHGTGVAAILELPGYSPGQPTTHVSVSEISNYFHVDYNGVHGAEVQLKNGHRFRTSAFPADISFAVGAALREVE